MATTEDVGKRLGQDLDEAETVRAQGLLEEASALVRGYLRGSYDPENADVVVVESRIAARALASRARPGVETNQESAGQVSHQQTFTADASASGGVWLAAVDKLSLADLRPSATSVPLQSERYA